MYIGNDGRMISSDVYQILDKIGTNFSIDVDDIPVSNYGIITNFSKDTYRHTEDVIKLMTMDVLSYNQLSSVTLSGIDYTSGVFTVLFDYKGKRLTASIN